MLYIDRLVCTGCGACLNVCPTGAISLDQDEGVSMLDLALCNECLLCLDACPNGAIKRSSSSELTPLVEGEIVEGEVSSVVPAASLPHTLGRSSQLATRAGTVLSFAGSWLLARAANVLLDAFERRLAGGANPALPGIFPRPRDKSFRPMGGGRNGLGRRQRRWRRRGR